MITQIYGICTVEDALGCIEANSDYLGVCVGDSSKNEGTVSVETAKEIFNAIGARATKLLIVFHHTENEMIEIAACLNPDILHLSGNHLTSESFYNRLKNAAPNIKLMQGVAMTGPEALDYAVLNEPYADYYILDSVRSTGVTGAAGVTHDWKISKKIIDTVKIPVVLAGGLGPDNVAAAIEAVRPFGVDSFTKTSVIVDGYPAYKDLSLVEEFNRIAHQY